MIHGGSAYSRYEDFIEKLKTTPLRDLPGSLVLERWSTKLAADLGEDYEVYTPSMPNKQNAKYSEWKIWFERYLPLLRDGVVMIGWSLGGLFLAKYLNENQIDLKIKSLQLLAAPSGEFTSSDGDDCGDFLFSMDGLVDWKGRVEQVVLWHSVDDPVVPFSEVDKYQKWLKGAELRHFFDRNHFLLSDFPELLQEIRKS